MADETSQITFTVNDYKPMYSISVNSQNQRLKDGGKGLWQYYEDQSGEATDMLEEKIKELCKQKSEGYKHEGWWKQVRRDGEEWEQMGLGCGDISSHFRLMDIPERVTVMTIGSNKIKMVLKYADGSRMDDHTVVFQHMKAHEVDEYTS